MGTRYVHPEEFFHLVPMMVEILRRAPEKYKKGRGAFVQYNDKDCLCSLGIIQVELFGAKIQNYTSGDRMPNFGLVECASFSSHLVGTYRNPRPVSELASYNDSPAGLTFPQIADEWLKHMNEYRENVEKSLGYSLI